MLELQHEIDVGKLQADDAANLKFDLEILTQEKQWQDQEIESLNTQLAKMVKRQEELESNFAEETSKQRSELEESHQRSLADLKQQLKTEQDRLLQSAQLEAKNQL